MSDCDSMLDDRVDGNLHHDPLDARSETRVTRGRTANRSRKGLTLVLPKGQMTCRSGKSRMQDWRRWSDTSVYEAEAQAHTDSGRKWLHGFWLLMM